MRLLTGQELHDKTANDLGSVDKQQHLYLSFAFGVFFAVITESLLVGITIPLAAGWAKETYDATMKKEPLNLSDICADSVGSLAGGIVGKLMVVGAKIGDKKKV